VKELKSTFRDRIAHTETSRSDAQGDFTDFIRGFLRIFFTQDKEFKEEWLRLTRPEKKDVQAIITKHVWKGVAAAWKQLVDDGYMSTENAASGLLFWILEFGHQDARLTAKIIKGAMWEAKHRSFLFEGNLTRGGLFKDKIGTLEKAVDSQ